MSLGKLISSRRKELGLTLEEVARAIGTGRSNVLRYEKGTIRDMGASKVLPLAEVLQLSPVTILEAARRKEDR